MRIHRAKWTRGYVVAIPLMAFLLYFSFQNPIALILISATFAAITLPIQSGAALWLQRNVMDQRVRPGRTMHLALWATFVFQVIMAGVAVWYGVILQLFGD